MGVGAHYREDCSFPAPGVLHLGRRGRRGMDQGRRGSVAWAEQRVWTRMPVVIEGEFAAGLAVIVAAIVLMELLQGW